MNCALAGRGLHLSLECQLSPSAGNEGECETIVSMGNLTAAVILDPYEIKQLDSERRLASDPGVRLVGLHTSGNLEQAWSSALEEEEKSYLLFVGSATSTYNLSIPLHLRTLPATTNGDLYRVVQIERPTAFLRCKAGISLDLITDVWMQ